MAISVKELMGAANTDDAKDHTGSGRAILRALT